MNRSRNFILSAHNIPSKGGEYWLFSIPQTNEYQIISEFSVKSNTIIEDKDWKNKIAAFALNDVENRPSISFYHLPKSIHKTIDISWTKNSYTADFLQKNRLYLKPNRFIDGNAGKVKEITQKLIDKETNLSSIVKKIYTYVLDTLSYGKPIDGLYAYEQAIGEKVVDCGGFSTLLLSLFQSLNIPGRLVVGFVLKKKTLTDVLNMLHALPFRSSKSEGGLHDLSIHAWPEILLPNGEWFPLDPSIEWRRNHGLSKRKGGFGFIPNDRLVVSYGQDINITVNGKKYNIDILQRPICI